MESSENSNKTTELSPKDFCFFLQRDSEDGDTYAYFVPLTYFRENKQMSGEIYDVLDEYAPEDMDEVLDNCYACSRSMEEVEKELLEIGFVEDEEFTKFMSDLDEPITPQEVEVLTGS